MFGRNGNSVVHQAMMENFKDSTKIFDICMIVAAGEKAKAGQDQKASASSAKLGRGAGR